MSSQKFNVTKELIEGYCQQGLTVSKMASAIREASGFPCSDAVVRKAAKTYGINLRSKPKESPFYIGTTNNEQLTKVEGTVEDNSNNQQQIQATGFGL